MKFEPGHTLSRGNSGGKPGRSGRIPSAVREVCRLQFAKRVPLLGQVADGVVIRKVKQPDGTILRIEQPATIRESLAAMEVLGKYAGLAKIEHSGPDDRPVEFALDLPAKHDAFDLLMARLARVAEGEPVARVLADGSVPATPEPELLPPGGSVPATEPEP